MNGNKLQVLTYDWSKNVPHPFHSVVADEYMSPDMFNLWL